MFTLAKFAFVDASSKVTFKLSILGSTTTENQIWTFSIRCRSLAPSRPLRSIKRETWSKVISSSFQSFRCPIYDLSTQALR